MRVTVESENPIEARQLVDAALRNEMKLIQIGLEKTKKAISDFEKRFHQTTEAFYQKYLRGEMGDSMDYMRWAGEYETLLRLKKDYKEMEGIEIC